MAMNGRSEQGPNEGFAFGPDRARVNLDSLVRDQSVVVARDADVWALIGETAFTTTDPPHSDTPPCLCRRCGSASPNKHARTEDT